MFYKYLNLVILIKKKLKVKKMIREVIRPQHTTLTINIPTSYIDKEVEFIMFPLDEKETTQKSKTKKSLKGVFNNYADNSKIPLEDNAWQDYIMDKYKQND
jgi:hypothetical protein